MAPLASFGHSIVVGLCVASATTDARTANNRSGVSTSAGGLTAGPTGSKIVSERTSNSSFGDGASDCVEEGGNNDGSDGCRGAEGKNTEHDDGAWVSPGETVDLDELADRVSDALVTEDAKSGAEGIASLDQVSSSPPAKHTRGGSSGDTTEISRTSNGCEHEEGRENDRRNGESHSCMKEATRTPEQLVLFQGGEKLSHPPSQTSNDRESDAAVEAVEAEVRGVCGEGEHQRICSEDEECCNSSCGICAPKGQPCLQIICGELMRGGGSPRSGSDDNTPASRLSRLQRQKALISSLSKDGSMPPKDRLEELQLQMPDLFAHVSLKGFKRLIAQVTRPDLEASGNNEAGAGKRWSQQDEGSRGGGGLTASPASRSERHGSKETSSEEGRGVGSAQNHMRADRSRAWQGQPEAAMADHRAYRRKYPSSESLQYNRSARGKREAEKQAEAARQSFSGSRSPSFDGESARGGSRVEGEGGVVRATGTPAVGSASLGGGARQGNSDKLTGRQRQRLGVVEDSPTATAISPSESNGLHYENRHGVGQTKTGLTDIDIAATMNGLLDREISEEMREESDRLGSERAGVIRDAMGLLWKGYAEHAWGYDEVKPMSKEGNNNWGGMGVTLVDSLDTLWLMGLIEEFYDARDWVQDHMTFDNAGMVSVFETTIRVLGGLLSAFDLSREKVFLDRAKELADRLMPAFETSTGLPYRMVNLSTGKTGGGSTSVLSELGTLQLEFRYLSRELGDEQYAKKAMRAFDFMAGRTVSNGLYPVRINSNTGKFTSAQVTFGAFGDSFYEYLLKVWMQGGRREDSYRKMYDDAMDGVDELLVQKGRGLTYLSEWNGNTRKQQHRMDHLACFMAGNLALGSITSQDPVRAARDLKTGKALAYTCYQMYVRTATGLSPEIVEFNGHGDMRASDNDRFYILRPETLESFFVLHQLTGDPIYREWGWEIFRAIERHCRVGVGYGSHPDVENPDREANDHMESFFPGETLKYLYLLMQPDHPIDLMEFTFSTEAHPLKIFSFDDGNSRSQILM